MAGRKSVKPVPSSATDPQQALEALLKNDLLPLCIIRDGSLVYGNNAFSHTFSLATPASGFQFIDLVAEKDRAVVSEELAALASGVTATARFAFKGLVPDGTLRDVEFFGARSSTAGGLAIAGLMLDVTELQRAQATLSSLAFVDALTGLPNRAQFLDGLRDALLSARTAGMKFAVLIGDLDGFKEVNDKHGHDTGDLVLQIVAKRLRNVARSNDTIARLGGDEFAMILPSVSMPEHAALVAGRIIRAVTMPIGIEGGVMAVGISVGVALHPAHGDGMDQLVHAADTAMYVAKNNGSSRYAIATQDDGNGKVAPLRFVEWSDSASVGVKEIDDQHRRITELINAVGEDLKSIQPHEKVLATMGELVDYTREHFEMEEKLLEVYAAGQLVLHRGAHRRLLEDLQSLAGGVEEQSMALTMRYLQDWLFAHIEAADRPLGETLNASGIR